MYNIVCNDKDPINAVAFSKYKKERKFQQFVLTKM